MSRGIPLSRRLARIAPVLGLLIAGVAPFIADHPVASAQEGPALLVDDAETANPELVEVAVADPLGFGVSGRTLRVPPGYSVSVVASGLDGPRFMDFDGDRQSSRWRGGRGRRLPLPVSDDGRLGEPEVPYPGLQQPASVAIFTADDGHVSLRRRGDPGQPLSLRPGRTRSAAGSHHPRSPHRRAQHADGGLWPDGMLYLAIGSSCNICLEQETDPRHRLREPTRTAAMANIFATGCATRSGSPSNPGPTSLGDGQRARQPGQRDSARSGHDRQRGRQLRLARLPCRPTPPRRKTGADCSGITPPTIGIQAHSAPLGLAFLHGEGSSPSRARAATSSSSSTAPGTGSHPPRRS